MIAEDYVSFEIAKLLKDKGFDEPCRAYWDDQPKLDVHTLFFSVEPIKNSERAGNDISCPIHQMAMKWLRKKHNILITIIPQEIKVGIDVLCYGIYRITEDLYQPLYNGKVNNLVDSYEDTIEAALKYSLENLI